jgi:tRNA pseudouridine38-40 synthase
MPRYKLIVAYDGTRFHGFQRQVTNEQFVATAVRCTKRPQRDGNGKAKPTASTIQHFLETAVVDMAGTSVEDIFMLFVSRTDKGVHARGQVVAITLPITYKQEPTYNICNSINSRLPVDVSVVRVELCKDDAFDPRIGVKQKVYSYSLKYRRKVVAVGTHVALDIWSLGPNTFRHAFDSSCLWIVPWSIDDSVFSDLCNLLRGSHDYSCFVHKHDRNQTRGHAITVDAIDFEILNETKEPAPVVTARFQFKAKGFRRGMVRNLVGFCVDVARGLVDVEIAKLIWQHSNAAKLVNAAPASGLCLESVEYE